MSTDLTMWLAWPAAIAALIALIRWADLDDDDPSELDPQLSRPAASTCLCATSCGASPCRTYAKEHTPPMSTAAPIVALAIPAGLLSIAGVNMAVRRVRLARHRAPVTREPVHPDGPIPTPTPTRRPMSPPLVPDTRHDTAQPEPHPGPTPHIGADEHWFPLAEIGAMGVSPELVTDAETDLRWALIWHNFEHTLQAEIGRIFAPALAWAEINSSSFDELRELLHLDGVKLVDA